MMMKALPLYVDLIFGGLFVYAFTGMWLILNDLDRVKKSASRKQDCEKAAYLFNRIRLRRVFSLFGGLALIVLFFFGRPMVVGLAILFGFLWLDSVSLVSKSRQFVTSIREEEDRLLRYKD